MATLTTIAGSDGISPSRTVINTNFSNLNSDKVETSAIDTDTALTANSDAKIPSQKAVKAYVDAGGNVNASETSKGVVEEATDTEVTAGTATGATGAKLFITPQKLASFFSGFGDGSDGALSISSGTTTLAADKQYTSVSVTGTAILETAGYRIYCQGTVTVDATSGACIRNNGGAGGNASGGTAGTAGAIAPGVTVPAGAVGIVGATGDNANTNGANGTAGGAKTVSVGVIGVAGGNGATSILNGGTGGAAGSLTASTNKLATIADTLLIELTTGALLFCTGSSGSGSGAAGGGNSGGIFKGGGGGSGASGGIVFIAAKSLALTGTGCIQAKGGAGGTGGTGGSGGATGAGGGGGGGAGGILILIYRSITGAGTKVVTGGAGGAAGTNTGYGAATAGANGTTGKIYSIQV